MRDRLFALIILVIILAAACTTTNVAPEATAAVPVPAVATAAPETVSPTFTETAPAVFATSEPATDVSEPAADTATAEPVATDTVTQRESSQETIVVEAADGLAVQTTLYLPAAQGPVPGVMLLHMLGSNRAAWGQTGLIDTLLADGLAVLAVDMRGYGETGGSADWTLAAEDLARVWGTFTARPEVDATRTAVVGASIGANMALTTAAAQPAIRTAVLLSPGLDYRGVTTEDQLGQYGERPLLIVASTEDAYAADSSRTLAESGGTTTRLELFENAGHGTAMFGGEPGLKELISVWLQDYLFVPSS